MIFIFQYACCGSYFNTKNNSWINEGPYETSDTYKVPETCCLKEKVGEDNIIDCRKNPTSTKYNLTGCFDKFDDLIEGNKKSVLAVGVTIVVIMVKIQSV